MTMNPSCKREDCTVIGGHSHEGLFERIAKFRELSEMVRHEMSRAELFVRSGDSVANLKTELQVRANCVETLLHAAPLLYDCQSAITELQRENDARREMHEARLHEVAQLRNENVRLKTQLEKAEALLRAWQEVWESNTGDPNIQAEAGAAYFREKEKP